MPALRKPHRIAVLAPQVAIEGADAAHTRAAALVVWTACIEACQRHPGLAVYDAESTPLLPQDGQFAPQHAIIGATPTDGFYGTTRRDEVIWLELAVRVDRSGPVRLHTLARDGARQSFDALGRNLGDQIQQVFTSWLAARDLPALPRRFEAVAADELLAVVRVVGPALAEHARKWVAPARAITASLVVAESEGDDETNDSIDMPLPSDPAGRSGPAIAARLPAVLRVAALRALELALREDLSDLVLATEPDHPGARFAQLRDRPQPDFAQLRQVIAAAPGWARPYAELAHVPDDPASPTALETVAGAGIAALCRPGQLDVVDTAAEHLREDGRTDEAIRLLERALQLHDRESRAHISLLHLHRSTDRIGAWLAQAHRSGQQHGCPMDPFLPWYPDQIQIDLLVADALMNAGRLDEAIALRANRLEGREATWPRHTRILTTWRKDPRFVAWCYAREGAFRGEPERAVEGFGRSEPDDSVDLAVFLDALVAVGREADVPLAWAQFGAGLGHTGAVARLAAARGLLAAGEWRRGLEELWRVELCEPGRDEQVAIARALLLASCMPIEVAEAALGERVATGAHTLARRMARDIADFVPGAAASSIVMRALGLASGSRGGPLEVDPAVLAAMPLPARARAAIDALFAALRGDGEPLVRADQLVDRWLDVVFAHAGADDPAALAQAAAYVAAQALGRYLAATTAPPSPLAGGLRTVAAEALALLRRHRDVLGDREVRALLGVLEPLLRRVDRWVGTSWLATVERSCGIDERAAGDVAGFVRDHATVAARILGPEEAAVLAASVARLHRERLEGWESATGAQAARLAMHTGCAGANEWADAVVAQLSARAQDLDDAVDALLTASYLAEGKSAVPCVHAARVLLDNGRAPAALAVLTGGLAAATDDWRAAQVASLAAPWQRANPGVPLAFEQVAAGVFEALQKGDPARAEKLGRWAVALDPSNAEAHRNLGLALAQQGKRSDALQHLVRGTREQATQILSGVLYQAGQLPAAMAVLDYASRWYVRADQWLTFGGIAYAAMDNPRTVAAYARAHELDPVAFDATQLNAYAGVLDEVGDYATCEAIALDLERAAGDDAMLLSSAWHHLACARLGQGRFDEAAELAGRAVARNPVPDNAAVFAATLAKAQARTRSEPPPPVPDPAAVPDPAGWRARRAALVASRARFSSENDVEVTPRARAAAAAVLADTDGLVDRDAIVCRALALEIREQAYFARDPVPRLGDRMTRAAFLAEFRARGGVVLGEPEPPPAAFVDRVVVPGSKVARASDYVALLRDLAALAPREAIAQFDLDDAGYVEVARAWGAALDADASLAALIAAGLAKR